jgi:uncharacterized protein
MSTGINMTALNDDFDPRFLKGVDLFNRREFFECHEVLEDLWKEQAEPERQLTQGIIQIAVAYHHCLRGNYAGAIKLFRRGIPRLQPFCTKVRTLQLADFIWQADHDLAVITSAPGGRVLHFPNLQITVPDKKT